PAFDTDWMNEALSVLGCLRRAAFAWQSCQKFARQIDRVHHAFGARLHRVSGDAIDDDFARIAGKGFPANLSRCSAVQGVSQVGSEHLQIQFVDAAADLLVGSKTDSD